jgi:zinc protease
MKRLATLVAITLSCVSPSPTRVRKSDEAFRWQKPVPERPRPLKAPGVQRFQLGSAITAYLVERPQVPLVSVSLVVAGGSALDPVGKEGLATVCSELLMDGTDNLETTALRDALAELGSTFSSGVSGEEHSFSMRTLGRNLAPAAELWAQALTRVRVLPAEFERAVNRRIQHLREQKARPAELARRLTLPLIYGEKHPEGRLITEGSLKALAVPDCERFMKEEVRQRPADLYVVGDTTKADVFRVFGPLLGERRTESQPRRPDGEIAPVAGRVFFVDLPAATQSIIYLMHAGPCRCSPDFYPTEIAAGIIADTFTGRITMNLRERQGYAYLIEGGVDYSRSSSVFRVSARVRSEVTAAAVIEMLNEMGGFLKFGPTVEELNRERSNRALALPARFSTNNSTLDALHELVFHRLPLDEFDHYSAHVQGVDSTQVLAVAREYLNPADLKLLVVGNGLIAIPALQELTQTGPFSDSAIVRLDSDGKAVSGCGTGCPTTEQLPR